MILERIISLKHFSETYFKKNKVPLVSVTSNESSDFDLIAKVIVCEAHLNMFKVYLKIRDDHLTINFK